MTAAVRPDFNPHSVWILTGTVVLIGVVSYVANILSLPEFIPPALIGGAGIVPGTIGYARWKRALGRTGDVTALGQGRLERPRGIVAILVGVILLATESFIGGLLGYVLDIGSAFSGATLEQGFAALSFVSLVFTTPLFLIAAFFILRRAAHYLWPKPFRWLLLSVGLYLVMRGILAAATFAALSMGTLFDPVSGAIGVLVVAGLLVLIAWVATTFARRRHSEFVAARFFHKLTPVDKQTVLAMLGEVVEPSARAAPAPEGE